MARIKRSFIPFVVAVPLLSLCATTLIVDAQPENTKPAGVTVFVTTDFDTSVSASAIVDQYYAPDNRLILTRSFSEHLKNSLRNKFDEIFLAADIYVSPDSLYALGDKTYLARCVLAVDDAEALHANISIECAANNRSSTVSSRVKKDDLITGSHRWQLLRKRRDSVSPEPSRQTIDSILENMALISVSRVDDDIFDWIVSSWARFCVHVDTFRNARDSEEYEYLVKELKTLMESRLQGSETIMVFADSTETASITGSAGRPTVDYVITGTFLEIGRKIKVDVRCIKPKSGRILVSTEVLIEADDMQSLTKQMTDAGLRLKRAMEADFETQKKTISVTAYPPLRIFRSEGATPYDVEMTKEIVRAMNHKLRLLTMRIDDKDPPMLVQVFEDTEKADEYITRPSRTSPADMLADLDVDYVLVVSYEDIGDDVRLCSNLHSYDAGHAGVPIPVHITKTKKADLNEAIDATIVRMLQYLKHSKLASNMPSPEKKLEQSEKDDVMKRLKEVKMPDARRNKGIGIRIGPAAPFDPDLYFGKESSPYYEVYFSYLVTALHWWVFDFGIEPSFGLNRARTNGFVRGVVASNGFFNAKTVISFGPRLGIPIIQSFGGGYGGQGVRYKYDVGDDRYLGDKEFDNAKLRATYNFFAETEFPINDTWRFHGFLRWVAPSEQIQIFRYAEIDYPGIPVGRMGGYYFTAGLEYTWR